ncbi:MAG: hypothetical protein LCH26_05980 [Proteobacteria bacterium]|nr:hypothetical protein [Pseudomonadota bacterium]
MSADLQKRALNAVTKLETKMQDLLDEQKRETELNIQLLQDLKARKQGDIKTLEEALKQESSVLYYAKTANNVTFGYLGKVVGWAKTWAEVGRDDIQSDIDNLKRNIADIEKKINDEGARMRNVITSPEFQKSQAKLAAKLADAGKELDNVQLIVAEVRQKTIFKPHNADADKLIAQLNDYIKKAKCDGITNIGTAKTAALDSCRAQYVEKIVKSKAKIPACAKLTATSSKDDFAACKKVL